MAKTILIAVLTFFSTATFSSPVDDYIADKYKKDQNYAEHLVSLAEEIGLEFDIDPALLLAIAETESSFNNHAVSRAGAKGLMQIIPKYHKEKLSGRNVYSVRDSMITSAEVLIEYGVLDNARLALRKYSGGARKYYERIIARTEHFRLFYLLAESNGKSRLVQGAPYSYEQVAVYRGKDTPSEMQVQASSPIYWAGP